MKRSKKIAIMLITALVMTASMVVVAFAEILYLPQYSSASDRYTQVYEMSTNYNWRYTTSIPESKWYGYNGENSVLFGVEKMHADRACAVQCTFNELSTFPTYYQVYHASGEVFPYTLQKSLIGTGYISIDFPYNTNLGYRMCLGIRNDPRKTSSFVNKGNWSPDTYN